MRRATIFGRFIVPEQLRAHHRRQRQRDEARNDHGTRQSQREFEEQASGRSWHEGDGRIDGGQRQRHRHDGEADLAHALDRRVERLHALLDVAEDVLEHDDGVVDDEADGEHHGEKRQRVDREARRNMIAKVATSEIGMVTIGMIEALSECRKNMMIRIDQRDGLEDRREHRIHRLLDELGRIIADLGRLRPRGSDSTIAGMTSRTSFETSSGLATACLMMPTVIEVWPI